MKAKSEKARLSGLQNKNSARLGRSGYDGIRKTWENTWNSLVERYPHLETTQNDRSKIWIVSRSRKNPLTGLHELVTDTEEKVNELVSKYILVIYNKYIF